VAVFDLLGIPLNIRANAAVATTFLERAYDRFRSDRPARGTLTANFEPAVADCALVIESPEAWYRLLRAGDGHVLERRDRRDGALESTVITGGDAIATRIGLVQSALLRSLAALRPDLLLVHGAAAGYEGGAIVLPGGSGRGKTVLSVALAQHGFEFLSDDVAGLDPTAGIIEPFPRGLNPTRDGVALIADLVADESLAAVGWPRDIEALVPGSVGRARPLRAIAFLRGFGAQPRLRRVSAFYALRKTLGLLHGSVGDPLDAIWRMLPTFRRTSTFVLTAGPPPATARLLRSVMEATAAA
jgi:hypothetical protein